MKRTVHQELAAEYLLRGRNACPERTKTVLFSIEKQIGCTVFVKKLQKYCLLYVKLLKKCGINVKLRDISFKL
jgi:hypothetical protein